MVKTKAQVIADAEYEERCRCTALAIRAGVNKSALAGVHEVSRPTIYDWQQRGEKLLKEASQ